MYLPLWTSLLITMHDDIKNTPIDHKDQLTLHTLWRTQIHLMESTSIKDFTQFAPQPLEMLIFQPNKDNIHLRPRRGRGALTGLGVWVCATDQGVCHLSGYVLNF